MRDTPYTKDEQRVADFIYEAGLGGGDDPIGFILASYAMVMHQRNTYRDVLKDISEVVGEKFVEL